MKKAAITNWYHGRTGNSIASNTTKPTILGDAMIETIPMNATTGMSGITETTVRVTRATTAEPTAVHQ